MSNLRSLRPCPWFSVDKKCVTDMILRLNSRCSLKSICLNLICLTLRPYLSIWVVFHSCAATLNWLIVFYLEQETEFCPNKDAKHSPPSPWLITKLWNSCTGYLPWRKSNAVPSQNTKMADIPINIMEICMAGSNKTGPVSAFYRLEFVLT